MRRPDRIRRLFHIPFLSRNPREEVEEEIGFHIRELTEKHVDRGWSPSDARQEALAVQPILGRGFQPDDEGEGAAAVALLAGWVPARQILRLDPMAHLRED